MITGARRIKDLIRNRAKGDSAKAQMLLRHFAMERLLERLSVSPYKSDFILKGGMLLSSIVGIEERMTRNIDATMRSRDMSPENVARIINEISSIDIGDGFTFELGEATEIMEDSEYGGVRIPVTASIERTKTTFKIDVSTGDAITPDAIEYVYRLMFEDRSISLHSYNDETFLGEKLETILSLATQNTRMRDFYDIWALRTSGREIDYALLNCALEATRAVRKSTTTIGEFKQIFALLQESTEMADAWRRYQLSNPFAESINWQDALAALNAIMTDMSSCSNANPGATAPWCVWRVAEHPEMAEKAAAWFSAKWGISEDAYLESMRESTRAGSAVPQWYIVRANNDPAGAIIAGCGIIENDFHDRPDLAPNLCALYVEEEHRHRGLARHLLDHARAETATMGYNRLYLVTDLVGFYEKCGWEYLGDAHELEGGTIRLYGAGTCFRES